ncbi:MAG: DUF2079 domain-containing protein [Candidatus Eremiobacteraeota bacterium]|nr:DUF2079 domain-containing protein [Candidatus Eremiobacteraeota bacterium]MBV8434865.1 DUF2079 domain-containing protein [Candidatus Eremiobacteraeota bacterium]
MRTTAGFSQRIFAPNKAARIRRVDVWLLGVFALFAALWAAYAYFALWRYDIFRATLDVGAFVQVAHSFASGFSSTNEDGANHFLQHFSPILAVTVPFVYVFHGALGLIVLETFATAATVFPIWGLAVRRFPKPFAFALTAVAAIYPPLTARGVGDFYEVAFIPFFAATLVWAMERRAWRIAILVTLGMLCSKEDQFVSVAFIGALVAVNARADRELRRFGVIVAAMAVGAAGLYFGVIRPLLNPHAPWLAVHYFQWWRFESTPNGFVSWNSPERLEYLAGALAPLAFLPCFSRYLLFAIPGFAEVLLSHERITMTMNMHYPAVWIGYVLAGFVDGASTVYRTSRIGARFALAAAIVLSIATYIWNDPLDRGFFFYRRPVTQDFIEDRLLRSLPENASIWGDFWLYSHLAMHPKASFNMSGQEYVVLDRTADAALIADNDEIRLLERVGYRVAAESGPLLILRRNGRR